MKTIFEMLSDFMSWIYQESRWKWAIYFSMAALAYTWVWYLMHFVQTYLLNYASQLAASALGLPSDRVLDFNSLCALYPITAWAVQAIPLETIGDCIVTLSVLQLWLFGIRGSIAIYKMVPLKAT